jgi:hypothetical protein
VFILAPLFLWLLGPQSFQQKLRQSLDQPVRMEIRWRLTIVIFEIENKLGSTAI